MKIEVLGASGSASKGCRLTSLLINDTIALDAGSLAQTLTIERQEAVRSILLTHSHLDHTLGLPDLMLLHHAATLDPASGRPRTLRFPI